MTSDDDWLGKLDALKELKTKHSNLDDIVQRLKDVNKQLQAENKCLNDFEAEIKLLEQERQSHVEIIRLINKDLEDMTSIHKRSEEHHRKLSKNLNELLEDYVPLSDQVNRLRMALEVEKIPDLSDEGITIPPAMLVKHEHHYSPGMMVNPNTDMCAFHPVLTYNQNLSQNPHLQSPMNPTGLGICDSAAFRQKPPPMKKCPTCANDIHRNAPICPMCKSKSHSKNPKKSKKKPVV